MEEAILQFLLNVPLNVTLSSMCVITFLFNYLILRTKKEYRGVHTGMFLVFLLPYFNIIFLFYHVLIAVVNMNGYKVVKVKKKSKTVPTTVKA